MLQKNNFNKKELWYTDIDNKMQSARHMQNLFIFTGIFSVAIGIFLIGALFITLKLNPNLGHWNFLLAGFILGASFIPIFISYNYFQKLKRLQTIRSGGPKYILLNEYQVTVRVAQKKKEGLDHQKCMVLEFGQNGISILYKFYPKSWPASGKAIHKFITETLNNCDYEIALLKENIKENINKSLQENMNV